MALYETIFTRRSVRQYDSTPLDAAELERIQSYISDVKQLPGQTARFEMVEDDKYKGGMAPHAILAYSEKTDAALVNVGYALQELDLWLQSIGYGSIWCGMASVKESSPDYRILLGFGKTSVPLRSGESDFKRKKLADMSSEDNAIARAARVAPSAVNFQPWKLVFSENKVLIHANVRGIGKVIPGKLYLYDLGIVTKHAQLALEHEGKTITSITFSGEGKKSLVTVNYE